MRQEHRGQSTSEVEREGWYSHKSIDFLSKLQGNKLEKACEDPNHAEGVTRGVE
jgi:hypothetical protein